MKNKKRRVGVIAKELNISSDRVLEYMDKELSINVSNKKHMTVVYEKTYQKILEHFDEKKYKEYLRNEDTLDNTSNVQDKQAKGFSERKMDIKSRSAELEDILSVKEVEKPKTRRRIVKKSSSKEDAFSTKKIEKDSKDGVLASENITVTPSDFPAKEKKSSKKNDAKKSKKKKFTKFNAQKEEEDASVKGKNKFKRKKKSSEGIDEEETVIVTKSKKKRNKKGKINQEDVDSNIKETLQQMSDNNTSSQTSKKKKKIKKRLEGDIEIEVVEDNIINTVEFISTSELAHKLDVPVNEIIANCFKNGLMVTINQRLDKETIELIAADYEYEVKFESEFDDDLEHEILEQEESADLMENRQPVVTIMGHVDHGKTTLLDYIRKSRIVSGESGGITQHIGAYEVNHGGKKITFLDTPGHEAFTAMRARGAKVTDIVVLVVAADDRVMPQTIEAIDHAKLAEVPIIIAINKIDKPNSDPERVKTELSQKDILVEDWGGKYQCVELSAKTGQNVGGLLESILLESEVMELKANPNRKAQGTVVESRLDKGLGSVATVLIQKGTLKVGDSFVCGQFNGKVRAMLNEEREKVESAGPSQPVMVLGFSGTPSAGDVLVSVDSDQTARNIANKRKQLNRAHAQGKGKALTLDQMSQQIKRGMVKELNIILKGDVDGSLEAISDSIMKLGNDEVSVRVISKNVGTITENDVLLAQASDAVILGFHVRPNIKAKELARNENIEIRRYSIIYDLIDDVKDALEGLLSPEVSEEVVAEIEIRDLFRAKKIGTIAGCYVREGKVVRDNKIKIYREGVEIYDGLLASLKRFNDDVREVKSGFECGLTIKGYNDLKEGDILEAYVMKETKRKLK